MHVYYASSHKNLLRKECYDIVMHWEGNIQLLVVYLAIKSNIESTLVRKRCSKRDRIRFDNGQDSQVGIVHCILYSVTGKLVNQRKHGPFTCLTYCCMSVHVYESVHFS